MKEYYKEYAFMKMPSGKYKGVFFKDLPDSYLLWAVDNWNDAGLRLKLRVEVARRSEK